MTARDCLVALCIGAPLSLVGIAATWWATATTGNPAATVYVGGPTLVVIGATAIAAHALREHRRRTVAIPRQRTR